MQNNIVQLSEQTLNECLTLHKVVMVDFSAIWCRPCQALEPLIDEIATDFAGKLLVGKVDIDKIPQLAKRYAVRSIPTILIFCHGQEVARHSGLLNKTRLTHWINRHLV